MLAADGLDDERHPVLSAHILVAEDNPINQMFVIELLQQCGCTCDVVDNGDEALVALQQHRYDLVLMDCQMPEMDGFTAAREIRRREAAYGASRHIPIIALTASALKGDRERCLDNGMDDYLIKPLQARQLLAMLEKYSSIKNLRIDSQLDAELSRSARCFPCRPATFANCPRSDKDGFRLTFTR